MDKVLIDRQVLAMMRNLIMLDGKRELLIAIADDSLKPAPPKQEPQKVKKGKKNV